MLVSSLLEYFLWLSEIKKIVIESGSWRQFIDQKRVYSWIVEEKSIDKLKMLIIRVEFGFLNV